MVKKSIIAFIMLVILISNMLCMQVNAKSTDYFDDGCRFITQDTPVEIIEYAKKIFLLYSKDELLGLGFEDGELDEIRLGTVISPFELDKCDSIRYYFPIFNHDDVIAIMTVSEYSKGMYSAQLAKSTFARNLNKLVHGNSGLYRLIICENGLYVIDEQDRVEEMESFGLVSSGFDADTIIDFGRETIGGCDTNVDCEIVLLNGLNYYQTSNFNSSASAASTISENYINVPFVQNTTTTDYPLGICWASCAASIIKNRTYLSMTGAQIRDYIVSSASSLSSNSAGNIYFIADVLNHYITIDNYSAYIDGWMPFANIQAFINTGKPIYTQWNRVDGGHAMVLRGYYYNPSVASSSNRRISVMDPNLTYYVSIQYASTYYNGLYNYSWAYSVR